MLSFVDFVGRSYGATGLQLHRLFTPTALSSQMSQEYDLSREPTPPTAYYIETAGEGRGQISLVRSFSG